jgi:drug/metabolite transporter (DMT)-like permease
VKKPDTAIALGLLLAIFLWGATNAGTKYIVGVWPPIFTGATRFLAAGFIMLAVFRWTNWLGEMRALTPAVKRQLWWRGGLSLAAYVVCFNWALRLTSASHVALYLGTSPVWALFGEGRFEWNRRTLQRYLAALIALTGVFVLFYPALKTSHGGSWMGEGFGLLASVLWTNYGRQSRVLGVILSGAQATAHTMWRAGFILLPLGLLEVSGADLHWRTDLFLVQLYCIIAGGVIAFALWNAALRVWPASRVLLFNNAIPLSTTMWSHFCLNEPITRTFWLAMSLIVTGVLLGQSKQPRMNPIAALPQE